MAAPTAIAVGRGTSVAGPPGRCIERCREQIPRHEDVGSEEPDDGGSEHRNGGEERAEPGPARPPSERDGPARTPMRIPIRSTTSRAGIATSSALTYSAPAFQKKVE